MPTGSPDYGIISGQTNETQSSDILELASRLNAIASVNRTGQQILSINEGLLYSPGLWYLSNASCYNIISLKYAAYNRPCLKCVTDTTASAYAGISLTQVPFEASQLGVAGLFLVGNLNPDVYLTCDIARYPYFYSVGLKLTINDGTLKIYDNTGAFVALGSYPVPLTEGSPFELKFTFDLDTLFYGSLFYGGQNVTDLSTVTVERSNWPSTTNYTTVRAYFQNITGVSNYGYIQDVLVTINEVL